MHKVFYALLLEICNLYNAETQGDDKHIHDELNWYPTFLPLTKGLFQHYIRITQSTRLVDTHFTRNIAKPANKENARTQGYEVVQFIY
jgi:hypothetical protein